ncbi:MAG: hypothetical protein QM831_18105 [Kofleriaceae bacterium]
MAVFASSCGGGDVVGPYGGSVRRFVIDRFDLPTTDDAVTTTGDDLDGDGFVDNALGNMCVQLAANHDLVTADGVAAMRASGFLGTFATIQATDFSDDDTVAVTISYLDDPYTNQIGGTLAHGRYRSNRTATTTHPAFARMYLPMLTDADPFDLTLHDVELDLVPDGDGYTGTIRGTLDPDDVTRNAGAGLAYMVDTNPRDHRQLAAALDFDHDGFVTADEALHSPIISALTPPDVTIAGTKGFSFGFAIHLAPCADGECAPTTAVNTCLDRVKDGDETDIDCGGSCHPCVGLQGCATGSDCDSGTCESTARCNVPTCTDGIQDGFENGIDCGNNCAACPQ